MLELILGGARSGKSTLAAARAMGSGREVVVLATARADGDAEMRERIERHRRDRPAAWITRETPVHLAQALEQVPASTFVIVDCLTLWLANLLYPMPRHGYSATRETGARPEGSDRQTGWAAERDALLHALGRLRCDAVLVSNELGLGLVPETEVGRRFRDEQGRLNQQVAALCERVTFVAAGLPLTLKAPC